jgi:hypothetical protein
MTPPTAAPAPRRGQPPKLDSPTARRTLLDAIGAGATLAQAAAASGITRATIHNTRRRDPAFDQALTATLTAARTRPHCQSCQAPALTLTPHGVTCTACHTRYALVAVPPVRAVTPLLHAPEPLAHAS